MELEVNDRGNLVIKHGKDEMNGKIIKFTISKRASGPYSIFVNRKKVFPEGSAFFLSFETGSVVFRILTLFFFKPQTRSSGHRLWIRLIVHL